MNFSPASLLRAFTGKGKSAPVQQYGGTWTPLGGQRGITDATLLEANREWVYIAVDRIAASMASIRFKVMKFDMKDSDQEVYSGPLIDFLENPGAGFTGKDFVYLNTVYKELAGNAFWQIMEGKQLQPLIPTRVQPVVDNGILKGYKYTDANGHVTTVLPENLLHDRHMDPSKPWWGIGKLQTIARWVDTSTYVTEFLSRFFVNGATFGGFITTEEESQERINLIKLGLANDHVGVANAHKIGVLPKGSDFKQTVANMKDMEMGDTDDRYRDKVLAGFGVPKTIVGLTTEVNRATAEASEYVYAKYTIKPKADDLIEFLNTNVAPLFDTTGQYYFAYDDFIPEDSQTKTQMRTAALANTPYLTINEVRAQVGYPPIEGGDVIYTNPQTSQPLGSEPPPPEPAPPDSPDADEPLPDDDADPEETGEPTKAIPSRARAAFRKERFIDDLITKAAGVLASREDPDAEKHKVFVARVEAYESQLAGKVRDFNNRQERDVASRLKHIVKAVNKGDIFDNLDHEVSMLVDFVTPVLSGLLTEQAVEEWKAQGFPGEIQTGTVAMRNIVHKAASRLAKSYNNTTANLITTTLNDGISNGESIPQLTQRVSDVYAYSNAYRAKSVAQTESFYIANEGSRAAYQQSGVVTSVRWYTAEDDQVCEFCGQEDGTVIDVDDNFYDEGDTITGSDGGELDLDYRDIDVPPLHTNCRCFILPEDISV